MDAYKLPDGRLLIPKRAEGPDGLIGDGWVAVDQSSEEYTSWQRWYERRGEHVPAAPPEMAKQYDSRAG